MIRRAARLGDLCFLGLYFVSGGARQLTRRWPPLVALATALGAALVYRLALNYSLLVEPVTPFSFVPNQDHFARLWHQLPRELEYALRLTGAVGLIWLAGRPLRRTRLWPGAAALGWLSLGMGSVVVGWANASHLRLIFSIHRGLDWQLVREGWGSFSAGDAAAYAAPLDVLVGLAPLAFLLLFSRRGQGIRSLQGWLIGLVFVLFSGLSLVHHVVPRSDPRNLSTPVALREPPLRMLVKDLQVEWRGRPARMTQRARQLGATVEPTLPSERPVAGSSNPVNLLVVLMESVGSRYVFAPGAEHPVPMPTLAALAAEGLAFENHLATGNTSPRAIFSIFTGLYPLPEPHFFSTRPDLYLPTLLSLLGSGRDAFLISPGQLHFYFPRGMFLNAGLSELVGFDELPPTGRPHFRAGRNELDGVDAMVARLGRAREPFSAVYYSYAPHYDYNDHGPEYRIIDDLKQPLSRYLNNLRLLDRQLERLLGALRERGALDRTLLLLVGDHGEAFGQHPGNWTHSRQSFQENFEAPAVIYWHGRLMPQRITRLTTHADLLPTVLDLLALPYEVEQFHGRSVLRAAEAGRPVFVYGNEDTLSRLDEGGNKLQTSFAQDRCWRFDLATDPDEREQLDCAGHEADLEELLRFRGSQGNELERYNRLFTPSR